MKMTTTLAATLLLLGGCASDNWEVDRVDLRDDVNLDSNFNENDVRLVFEEMGEDALSRPWVENWQESTGERPKIIIGPMNNKTEEYIDTELFTRQFERQMVNSGRVRVLGDQNQRAAIRKERVDQQAFVRPEDVKKVANELGADFMVLGDIGQIRQDSVDRKTKIQYYQVNLEMVDVETLEKVWIGTKEIRKRARR